MIDYPESLLSVYLCDDGKDDSKESMLCEIRERMTSQDNKVKLEYLTRTNNNHAKAGNLNSALLQTYSDLIMIFDADFIAYPNIIRRMLPFYYKWEPEIQKYVVDQQLAFVQAPQR